jgi:ribosomal-protein-alanine N-acetyltransferase
VHLEIRDFRRADFDELWRIDQECFDPGISYSRIELDHYVRRRRAFTLIAESVPTRKDKTGRPPHRAPGSTIVGFIVVEQDTRGRGHVITIDVRPAARRAGVGTKLMNAAEQKLRDAGCHAIFLETAVNNISALSFYKRHGYSVLKTIPRYYQNNLDAFLLGKRLEAGVSSQES